MTTVDDQQSGLAMRVALAKLEDRREVARKQEVVLRLTAVTLAWLVLLAMLLGYGLVSSGSSARPLAALVAVVGPFVAAVIATRHRYPWLGAAYVVLTLAMVIPAVGMVA
ncbi:hypothetical protein AB0M20_26040 [Actinoplanes sp. NPDC051633]|uniref:hypothetical protein n=1 Tax=Actinoplanes sp. NPDC051633 TaxID=3155670 RepID=UPI003433F0FF